MDAGATSGAEPSLALEARASVPVLEEQNFRLVEKAFDPIHRRAAILRADQVECRAVAVARLPGISAAVARARALQVFATVRRLPDVD